MEEQLPEERADRHLLKYSLSSTFFSPDDATLAIETGKHLLRYTQLSAAVDLPALANYCERLAHALNDCYTHLPYPNLSTKVDLPSWFGFWFETKGKLVEKLNTSELKTYLEEQRCKGHENRLKAYFFKDDLWNELPEDTRQLLITADMAWAGTEMGEVRSALDNLRLVTEPLFYEAIIVPLKKWQRERGKGELMQLYLDHPNAERSLLLTKYQRICQQRWFH